MAETVKKATSATPEMQVKAALLATGGEQGKRLADETKVLKFLASQLIATASLSKQLSSPAGITATLAKKVLFSGGFIAESDISRCSIAVGLLAAQSVGAIAAGVPTGGAGTVMMAAGLLSQVYNAHNSCKMFY